MGLRTPATKQWDIPEPSQVPLIPKQEPVKQPEREPTAAPPVREPELVPVAPHRP